MKIKFKKFIEGETIDLVIPNKEAANKTEWYNWFNKDKSTKYLAHHGLFPNTRSDQNEILKQMLDSNKKKTGLFLLIVCKDTKKLIGVTALSTIDWINRSAYLAIIISPERKKNFIFNSVEVKALMTKHAFDKLNLYKVRTSQVLELSEWQKYSHFFGYKVEGVFKAHFLKDHKMYDVCFHACILEDYLKARKKIGEAFWPGKKKFFRIMMKYPKGYLYENVKKKIDKENLIYQKKIGKLY